MRNSEPTKYWFSIGENTLALIARYQWTHDFRVPYIWKKDCVINQKATAKVGHIFHVRFVKFAASERSRREFCSNGGKHKSNFLFNLIFSDFDFFTFFLIFKFPTIKILCYLGLKNI